MARLRRKRGINLLWNRRGGKGPYQDRLCFFRCVALSKPGVTPKNLETQTKALFSCYQYDLLGRGLGLPTVDSFPGITLEELERCETLFQVNVEVYGLNENTLIPHSTRKSTSSHPLTIRLLQVRDHFAYLHDLAKFSPKVECELCFKAILRRQLACHKKTCKGGKTRERYPGGVFKTQTNIRRLLELHGVEMPEQAFHPHVAALDFESYFPEPDFTPEQLETESQRMAAACQREEEIVAEAGVPAERVARVTLDVKKLRFIQHHVPLSVSVCSNVPGYTEAHCMITTGSSEGLIDDLLSYLRAIQRASAIILADRWQAVFRQIDAKITALQETDKADNPKHPLQQLRAKVTRFTETLPCLLFNGSSYDLPLVAPWLLPHFASNENAAFFKRGNSIMMLTDGQLKFLDVKSYLGAGASYSSYLKAYQIEEEKLCFPYTYVTSLEKLEDTSLPPREEWRSQLKNQDLSPEEYTKCQGVWEKEGCSTLRDYLIRYNNADVKPFIKALEKQMAYNRGLGMDLFIDAISLPGLTEQHLHNTAPPGTFFTLFSDRDKELHRSLQAGVVGGPAITFTRHHARGETTLRAQDPTVGLKETCASIHGYDANSMYLTVFLDPIPCQYYHTRHKDDDLRLRLSNHQRQSKAALQWISYLEQLVLRRPLSHQYGQGYEHRLGYKRIPVDAFDLQTATVYQFHGCWYHGCYKCHRAHNLDAAERFKRQERTQRVTAYLKDVLGHEVVSMYECDWDAFKTTHQNHPTFAPWLKQYQAPYTGRAWRLNARETEEGLKALIVSGELFGLVQADVRVPPDMRDLFKDFPPVFKNTEVGRDDISPHMRDFAEHSNLLKQPRRTLISSYEGKQMWFVTPLLQFYLSKGVEVTNITQVLQYTPKTPFKGFVDRVTDARRQADADPALEILGLVHKLMGQAGYGKCLMRKDLHTSQTLMSADKAMATVQHPRFVSMVRLTDDLYDVKMKKKVVNWSLPLVLGVWVYGKSKLALLKFFYDCINLYIPRPRFELITCDTDSIYLALSTDTWDQAVHPHLRQHFHKHKARWFPRTRCVLHEPQEFELEGDSMAPPAPTRDCCYRAYLHAKREPGLWKQEAKAAKVYSLAAKSYICADEDDRCIKMSAKGVQRRNVLDLSHYQSVLETRRPVEVTNMGFRLTPQLDKRMATYILNKVGLSYLYIKRKVLDDGVSTEPLDI